MYPVQASLKQLQFLYNWSTEVPEGEDLLEIEVSDLFYLINTAKKIPDPYLIVKELFETKL